MLCLKGIEMTTRTGIYLACYCCKRGSDRKRVEAFCPEKAAATDDDDNDDGDDDGFCKSAKVIVWLRTIKRG